MSRSSILILIFFLIVGCSGTRLFMADRGLILPDAYSHQVTYKGETLATIARWYTGNYKNWKKLAEFNKLQDPNKIEIGQKIFVPNVMLKKSIALPEDQLVAKRKIKLAKNKEVTIYKRASLKISKPTNINLKIVKDLELEESLKKIEQEKSLNSLKKQ